MRLFVSSSAVSRFSALCVAIVLAITYSSPVRAEAPPSEPADPLQVLIDGDPHDFLTRDAAGTIHPITEGLDPFAAMILTQAAETLNGSSAAGHLSVSSDFSVKVTKAGREHVRQIVEEQSGGCDRLKKVTADWLGFHVEVKSECTAEELAARTGLPVDGSDAAARNGQILATSGENGGMCWWSVAGFTASIIGLLLLVSVPPAGALWWLGVTVTGVGTISGAVTTTDACAGLYDVDKRYRVGSGTYRGNCFFQWNSNWGYDADGDWVPFSERWSC